MLHYMQSLYKKTSHCDIAFSILFIVHTHCYVTQCCITNIAYMEKLDTVTVPYTMILLNVAIRIQEKPATVMLPFQCSLLSTLAVMISLNVYKAYTRNTSQPSCLRLYL